MSAEPVDQTRLTAVPSQPEVDDHGNDRMSWLEVAVDFILDELPGWLFVALMAVTATAGAVEMFIELGPWLSALLTVVAIVLAIYGGSRLRRLPLVPVVVKKRGSRD